MLVCRGKLVAQHINNYVSFHPTIDRIEREHKLLGVKLERFVKSR